jgi:hypothetical protein
VQIDGATLGVAPLGAIIAAASHGAPTAADFLRGLHAALLVGAATELTGALVALAAIDGAALRTTQPTLGGDSLA